MTKTIHIFLKKRPAGKAKDAREQKFGLPVYTEEEIKQKLRAGEWEAETDVVKGKRVEMRQGSKRFQVYVAEGTKDASFEEVMRDPEGKRLVEGIESTIASLRGKKGDKTLEEALAKAKADLKRKFGYTWQDAGFTKYDPREVNRLKDQLERLEQKMNAFTSSASLAEKAKVAEEIKAVKKELSQYRTDDAAMPDSLTYQGSKYIITGKTGKTTNGLIQHEYEAVDKEGKRTGQRIWRTEQGRITEDSSKAKDAAKMQAYRVEKGNPKSNVHVRATSKEQMQELQKYYPGVSLGEAGTVTLTYLQYEELARAGKVITLDSKDTADALSPAEQSELSTLQQAMEKLDKEIERKEDQGVTVLPADRQKLAEMAKKIHQLTMKGETKDSAEAKYQRGDIVRRKSDGKEGTVTNVQADRGSSFYTVKCKTEVTPGNYVFKAYESELE